MPASLAKCSTLQSLVFERDVLTRQKVFAGSPSHVYVPSVMSTTYPQQFPPPASLDARVIPTQKTLRLLISGQWLIASCCRCDRVPHLQDFAQELHRWARVLRAVRHFVPQTDAPACLGLARWLEGSVAWRRRSGLPSSATRRVTPGRPPPWRPAGPSVAPGRRSAGTSRSG